MALRDLTETTSPLEKHRISLTRTNAVTTSNVTEFIQPTDNLHEAIEALHFAQIAGGEYRYMVMGMASALISEINTIFPMHMILIYMATSAKRRQVWHAYIAAIYANPKNTQPIANPDAVRAKLMNTNSKKLLHEAYGMVPEGFQNALERIGQHGEAPHIYLLLHEQMNGSAGLRKAYSHTAEVEAQVVETLDKLPNSLQSYDLAKQFRDPEDIETLRFLIDMLSQGDGVKYSELCSKVVQAAERGHSVSAVLKRQYYHTPFPEPVVADTEFCKHIGTCDDLRKAAIQFKNCLRDYCEEGIRGEYQYYRWYENNCPVAVISLREDAPFFWRIYEIKGKRNEYLDDELELRIIKHFENHGVHKMSSTETLIRELGGMLKGERNQFDSVENINHVIDELLAED